MPTQIYRWAFGLIILLGIGILAFWIANGPSKTVNFEMIPTWNEQAGITSVLYGVRYVWDGTQPGVTQPYHWLVTCDEGEWKVRQFPSGTASFSEQWIISNSFAKGEFVPQATRGEILGKALGFDPLFVNEKRVFLEIYKNLPSTMQLAIQARQQDNYEKAEALFKEALAIDEKALGQDHPAVGASLENLASLYEAQERYADAEPLFGRALAIWEKSLGPEHISTAAVVRVVANFYKDWGENEKAEALYRRSLTIDEKILGSDSPHLVGNLEEYSALLRSMKRDDEATVVEQRIRMVRERPHPDR